MVQTCSAYNCTERATLNTVYAFHRFPTKNKNLTKAWCIALRRKDFYPQKHSRICSKHFTADSYEAGFKFRKLKKNAIPTIFDFGESNQSQRTYKRKRSPVAANPSYEKCKYGMKCDGDEEMGNVCSDSENESDQKERIIEVIKLSNYEQNRQTKEHNTDSEIAKDCDLDYTGGLKSSSFELISNNGNSVQLCVTSNASQQKQHENEKLRQTIRLLHKRMEKFTFLIECLHSTDMITEEAAFVLRSTMEM